MSGFRWLVMTAAVLAACGAAAEAAPLRVAIEGDGAYSPFSFFKPDKTLTGFDIEITDALCKHIPEGCQIIPVNFELIVDGLAAGTYDASISSMGLTKDRADKILFGPTYYRSHTTFMGRPDRFSSTSPEALKGARLASAQGTIQQKYLTETYPQSIVLEAKDMTEAFDMLVKGKVDLILADDIVQMDFLQSKDGTDFGYVGEPLKADILNSAAYVTFRKGLEAQSEEFAVALKHIRLDGTYDRINRSFVPFSIW